MTYAVTKDEHGTTITKLGKFDNLDAAKSVCGDVKWTRPIWSDEPLPLYAICNTGEVEIIYSIKTA